MIGRRNRRRIGQAGVEKRVLAGGVMYERLQREIQCVRNKGTQMNMDAMLVMLLVIVFVPGVIQVFSGMVIVHGMSVGMLFVRNVRTLNDPEQQGIIE